MMPFGLATPWICTAFAVTLLGYLLPAQTRDATPRRPTPIVAQALRREPLLLGTAWYPEQWPESRWEADLTLMEQAHIHVVRMGEFAWSTMEPREGEFEFAWLQRAIGMAARHHIYVVLGTPTAAPPAWLTSKYPQTLRVDENGRRAEHGNRQQFSFTNPTYRRFAAQISAEMAKHFGHNPDVIGWQIDNELAAPSFDPSARSAFHAWLAQRYGSIANLNRRWATPYWSQTYDDFGEIPVHSRDENPALLLDWKRFVTSTWVSYCENEMDAMRPYLAPTQWITTNTMHWFAGFDHYRLHRVLDLAAWDDYVPDGLLDPELNGVQNDLVRGYKQENFWVMETQPAFVNWGPVNSPLPRGVTREMAWQDVAHGADAVLFWQWRSAPNGQEQYHGTLLGADGTPVPVYSEIQWIGEEMDRVNSALGRQHLTLSDFNTLSRVAMLQDYDSRWAIDFQRHNRNFEYTQQFTDLYRAVQPIAQNVDVISSETALDGYAVVFAPSLNVLPNALGSHLLAYVRNGGHLVLTARCGMKNEDDGLQPERQPGPLAAALGARVEQFYALDAPVEVNGDMGKGHASIWGEELEPTAPGTRVLLTYGSGNSWLVGHPAAVMHAYGKGLIVYLGADLDPALMKRFAASMLNDAGIQPILRGLPEGVELTQRTSADGYELWFLMNHTGKEQNVSLTHAGEDLLTGDTASSFQLKAHDVVIWEWKAQP